jgi:tryptophan synthase beta chain
MTPKIPTRLYLSEEEIPRYWYNLRVDMGDKPDPILHP